MWKLCEKTKGAISVFLTLILIPTFIFSGVLVDGSRILGAKNLISGAGELAMNGALSNYHEELNKTYGLLAMADTAEEVDDIMQDFFETTLNYSGLHKEDVSKALVYLELVDGSFYTSNIPGSEIFQTEVLRQEILEYMKYRAPVTGFNRAIKDKLDPLADLEKEKNAADGQLKFEREMKDLQDIFDKIKERTDELQDNIYKRIYSEDDYDDMLKDAKKSYKEIAMLAPALYCMNNYASSMPKDGSTEGLMQEMVDSQYSGEINADNASKIINMIGISSKINDPYEILEGLDIYSDEYSEKYKLIEEYYEACENMSDGVERTEKRLDELVKECYEENHEQYELAKSGIEQCDEISELLDKLEKKLSEMEGLYRDWEGAAGELSDGESKQAYEKNLEENNFFNETSGLLADFRKLIDDNRAYFQEVKDQLDELTFTDQPLHEINNKNKFLDKADYGLLESGAAVESAGQSFMQQYHDIGSMALSVMKKDINLEGNEFMEKLEYYCDTSNADSGKQKEYTDEWDKNMEEQSETLEEEEEELREEFKSVNLVQYKNDLPSYWIKNGKNSDAGEEASFDESGSAERVTIDGGLDESKRENAYDSGSGNLNKDNVGIAEISGLPELLAGAGEAVAEPLIMTEYVMGMFSYYTCDVDTEGNPIEDPLSLTDDELKEHALYRAEIEYILWGRPELRDNVTITKSIIFAANMIFNLSFAFTDSTIRDDATMVAAVFPVGALGKTAIKCALQTLVAMVETVKNMNYLMEGKPVPLVKHGSRIWETPIITNDFTKNDGTTGFTYEDYLWIMVCVKMFIPPTAENMLARTADCIELNMTDLKSNESDSLKDMYTMIDMEAEVSIDTFFLPKLNGAGYNVQKVDKNTFTLSYYGVQGY